MPRSLDDRLIDLEILVTHLDRKIEELSQVVREQADEIDSLKRELKRRAIDAAERASSRDAIDPTDDDESQLENF